MSGVPQSRCLAWVYPFAAFAKLFLLGTVPLLAQLPADNVQSSDASPTKVTLCELSKNPGTYNHKLVELTSFVSFAFEDFSLFDPECEISSKNGDVSIWLTYGGTARSGAVYCCPGEGAKEVRREDVSVEGIPIPLVANNKFTDFRNLLNKERDTTVKVTLIGRFFSGNIRHKSPEMPAYGHFGCCSLFVIQEVESFEPHDRTDLNYSTSAGWYESEGCNFISMHYLSHASHYEDDFPLMKIIALQRAAEDAEAWRFSDPERVAIDALASFYPGQKIELKLAKQSKVGYAFRWKHENKSTVAVVVRPYWLSFYAKTKPVVWVATTLKEAECGKTE